MTTASPGTQEWDLFVGNNAHPDTLISVCHVPSLVLMEEELDTLYGPKANVKETISKDVRRMDWSGTLNAKLVTMPLDVASAAQIALTEWETTEPSALNVPTEGVSVPQWVANQENNKMLDYAMTIAEKTITVLDPFAGENVPQDSLNVEPFV